MSVGVHEESTMTSVSAETLPEAISPQEFFLDACERNENVPVSSYLLGDNLLERLLAGLMLIPALPVIGFLIVLIRVTSKGPGLFRQQRLGKNGTEYMMYKLRTMRCDAEASTGPVWSTHKDSRMTSLGKILRAAHLDELPQLYNVWKGEMSLVGPRPERPEFVSVLEKEVPGYCERLRVLPGITGLAQVNLPADTNIASVRRKVRLDVEYICTADLLLDARIILCTLLKVFFIPSAWRVQLSGVDRSKCLHDIELVEEENQLTPSELVNPKQHRERHSAAVRPHKPK